MKIDYLKAILLCSVLTASPTLWAIDLFGNSNFKFDPRDGDGALGDGTIDAYDGSYYLSVNGTQFSGVTGVLAKDNRTVNYPLTDRGNGLSVSRSFYVPVTDNSPNADYGRYVDCVKNTSTAAISNVDVQISGNLGSDSSTFVYASSNDNASLETTDTWLGTDDNGGDPSLAHVFGNGISSAVISGEMINWHFVIPNLEPAKTACFLTYAVQATNQADAKALAQQLSKKPDLKGITSAMKAVVQNFDTLDYATVTVFPATGDVINSANFDADIILTGSNKALQGANISIQLNGADISASCGVQQSLLNDTTAMGRVIHCPAISSLLTPQAKNDLVVTHTSASGGKTISRTFWTLRSTQALTTTP